MSFMLRLVLRSQESLLKMDLGKPLSQPQTIPSQQVGKQKHLTGCCKDYPESTRRALTFWKY